MIIGIVGPTGSGKSAVGITLAQALGAEIISVDAYQIYQGMDIGTAKVMPEDRGGIPHHFIDHVSAQTSYDVARYQTEARATLKKLQAAGTPVIFVGGSGYYLKAVLHDFQFSKAPRVTADLAPQEIWALLSREAPELLNGVHPNNHKRLQNRYQRYMSGQETSSVHEPVVPYTLYGLDVPLDELKARTDARIDAMVKAGLEKEVRTLYQKGLSPTAAEAIGYKEWKAYLAGVMGLGEVIDLIKTHTHQYIKKQRTYFTRQLPITWIEALTQSQAAIVAHILEDLKNKASTH